MVPYMVSYMASYMVPYIYGTIYGTIYDTIYGTIYGTIYDTIYGEIYGIIYYTIYGTISEIGGKEAPADPNREIGFGFVSCSCRACVRAKLCGCVRDVLLNAGVSNGKMCDSGGGFPF
jgi:hypothetical protein